MWMNILIYIVKHVIESLFIYLFIYLTLEQECFSSWKKSILLSYLKDKDLEILLKTFVLQLYDIIFFSAATLAKSNTVIKLALKNKTVWFREDCLVHRFDSK